MNLFLGLGGAGCKLVNNLMDINSANDGVFVNSNANEMRTLSNYHYNNSLNIKGTGTGRNRTVAQESLKNDINKFSDFIFSRIGMYDTFVLVFSLDGGFGSGSFKAIARTIKHAKPEASINILAVIPKKSARKINLENTLGAYTDIIDLSNKNVINSYQFIDNDKMVTEKEFNNEVMQLINDQYELASNELDASDSSLINNSKGYKVALKLEPGYTIDEAIQMATEYSPLVLPENICWCTHFGASVQEEHFDKDELANYFEVTEFDKEDYNDNRNIIVLGGCDNPDMRIRDLEDVYNGISAIKPNTEYRPKINIQNRTAPSNTTKPTPTSKPSSPTNKMQLRDELASLWD